MQTKPGATPAEGPTFGGPGDRAPEDRIGDILGGYKLTALLGGGGMGLVYEASRTDSASFEGPEVAAIKVLSPAFSRDPQFVERFRREADALTRLRHQNLIEVYARGEDEQPCHFFIMERFYGGDLRSLVSKGVVSPKQTAAIIKQAASGLAYAHTQGIVHRDIKPANILVRGDPSSDGSVKVVDFGVAQLATSSYTLTSLTSSDLILGTINYMSPEQRVDASQIDHRADIYALGVVAYELLTGRLPIGAFEPPSQLRSSLSRAVDRAVLAALRRAPEHRPDSVELFAERLERALAPKRKTVAIAAGAAFAVVLGGMGVRALLEQPKQLAKTLEPQKVARQKANSKKAAPVEKAKSPEPPKQQAEAALDAPQLSTLDPLVKTLRKDANVAFKLSEVPKKRKRKVREIKK